MIGMQFPRAAALIGLALTLANCGSARKELPYADEIKAERGAKDRMLESAADSPVTADKRQVFLPLAYFDVDEGFRVPAQLAAAPGEQALEMPTSRGERRQMRRAG